jgi:hypothetical protein
MMDPLNKERKNSILPDLSESLKLIEKGRADTTSMAEVSITIHTTVQLR